MTTLAIGAPHAVSIEGYYSGSVIARKAFTISVTALTSGIPDTSYNGSVTIYANSASSDTAYTLGSVYLSNGSGTSGSLTISSVLGNGSGRKITVRDSYGNTSSVSVGVWFQGDATTFDGHTGDYCGNTPPTYYVALPAYSSVLPCGTSVVVYNPGTGKSVTAQRYDVGPFVPYHSCSEDPYWQTGNIPFNVQHKGETRGTLCGYPSDTTKINGAIIDLGIPTAQALGSSGYDTIPNALWRFT
ncbi:hypothetical protein ACFQZT_15120 [Paenibacillus sp. GCM10027628]|uniref:hypothetical protein n=1 Tax=Paenibacillus sp. GCM10027628 TaxID=3273413 RepID=UPI00363CF14D